MYLFSNGSEHMESPFIKYVDDNNGLATYGVLDLPKSGATPNAQEWLRFTSSSGKASGLN